MTRTTWVLAALVLGLFGYEGYTLGNSAEGDTISEVVWALSDRYPVLVLFFGILYGHWFWQRKRGGNG
ncbi:MAG: hypothetical protein IT348_05965 [Candidatus Eisenbacteria bacterium]|nr:hypothetical protein [Candidatus Eisenbacteria bacterium]